MDEGITLADYMNDALHEWLAGTEEGGMVSSFIVAADLINADGTRSNVVVSPDVSISSALGLAHYAVNWFSEIQRSNTMAVIYADTDEVDDE